MATAGRGDGVVMGGLRRWQGWGGTQVNRFSRGGNPAVERAARACSTESAVQLSGAREQGPGSTARHRIEHMSELPPDLPRLRTIVTYLRNELSRAEQALAFAEEQAKAAARRRPPPEPPAWVIEQGIGVGRPPVSVHAGDCWDRGKRWRP